MLPALPIIDLLSLPPDGDIDLFVPLSKRLIPNADGVYCFYDPTSGQPRYIGSACGHPLSYKDAGLKLRARDYSRSPNPTRSSEVAQIARKDGLRFKWWLTHSDGDARKYEIDAIQKYQPDINVFSKRKPQTEASRRKYLEQRWAVNQRQIKKWQLEPYDPERLNHCRICKKDLPCKDFHRSSQGRHGVQNRCKVCRSKEAKARPLNKSVAMLAAA